MASKSLLDIEGHFALLKCKSQCDGTAVAYATFLHFEILLSTVILKSFFKCLHNHFSPLFSALVKKKKKKAVGAAAKQANEPSE